MTLTRRVSSRAQRGTAESSYLAARIPAWARRHRPRLFIATLLAVSVVVGGSARAGEPPRLAATIMDIGRPFSLRLRGEPEAPFALLLDSDVSGPRETRAGTLCLDLRSGLRVLRDGLTLPGPTLDSSGRYVFTKTVPERSALLGLEVTIQGVVADRSTPSGLVLSNCIRRVVGNGSTGNFRKRVIELPWDQDYLAHDVEVCDFDGDGSPDIVVAGGLGVAPFGGQLFLFLNDGTASFADATFGATTGIPVTPHDVFAVTAGDVDSDGDLDLIQGGGSGAFDRSQHHLFLNDSRGLFVDGTFGTDTGLPIYAGTSAFTSDIKLVDTDNDGDLDVVLDGGTNRPVRAWMNTNGRGRFVETWRTSETRFSEDYYGQYIDVGDVNGDGAVDVLGKLVNLEPILFVNNAYGYFHRASEQDGAGLPPLENRMSARDSAFADFDMDGDLDCFVASGALPGGSSQDLLLINSNGLGLFIDGTFGPQTGLPLRTDLSVGVAAGDIDRDGDLDLVVDAAYEGDQLLLNEGGALFGDASSTATTGLPQLWEVNEEIALADLDADGDLEIVMAFARPRPRERRLEGVKVLFNE